MEKLFNEDLGISVPSDSSIYVDYKVLTVDDYASLIKSWLDTEKPFTKDSPYREYSDISIAKIFAKASYPMLVNFINPDTGKGTWRKYNQGIWANSDNVFVERSARIFAECFYEYVNESEDLLKNKTVKAGAENLLKTSFRNKLIRDAEGELPMYSTEVEKNKFLIVFENGTFDGRNSEFREHRSEDIYTRKSSVVFDPEAKCEEFEEFLNETFDHNQELIGYVKRLFGSMLIGTLQPQEFYIFYGETRSGKGVLLKIIANVLGCYAMAVKEDLFIAKKEYSRGHNESLASLAGIRLVYMDEVDKNQTLNSKLMKVMTGGTPIRASRKHEHEFTFLPQWHAALLTNHKVNIDDQTVFDSNRVVVIPFNRHHTMAEIDPRLEEKLTSPKAASAILNWLIQGYSEFKTDGYKLVRPKCIDDAIEEYRGTRNYVAIFADENLKRVYDASNVVEASKVYERYCAWCSKNQCLAKGKNKFYEALRELGYNVSKGTGNKDYVKNVVFEEIVEAEASEETSEEHNAEKEIQNDENYAEEEYAYDEDYYDDPEELESWNKYE